MTISLSPDEGTDGESRVRALRHAAEVDVEIVIPAFNEERRLHATVADACRQLTQLPGLRSRVTIVDNGSADRTADLVDAMGVTEAVDVRVIGCATAGKGAAVRRGVLASHATVVGFLDADGSAPPSAIPLALQALRAGSDVVIGSRRMAGSAYVVKQGAVRRAGSWAFRASVRSTGLTVDDSQCGFKFFTRDAALAIFRRTTLNGFPFDVEVLLVAERLGLAVAQVPILWADAAGSTLRPLADARALARDIRMIRRLAADRDGRR